MLGHVAPIVAAGVEVKFVRYAARNKQLVKLLCACVKAKIVLSATIKINPKSRRARGGASERERIVLIPVSWVGGRTESAAENLRKQRAL